MSQYFPKLYEPFGGDINVKVDLSNYETKTDIKKISHVDSSSFALKTNLGNLKIEVDTLDIDKLVPVPTEFSKLSNVVKNDVIKKTDYNSKITKIEKKIPDISNLVTKTALNTYENKIPDISGLVKKTNYNTKITEIEGKIPDVTNLAIETALNTVKNKISDISRLATKTALTTVENKIPDVSNFATKTSLTNLSNAIPDITNLIKKSDYDIKIAEIENKYVSNTGFDSKLAQANVITKRNFDAKIIEIENNIKNLQAFDSGYFRSKSHFEDDGTQNYLVFQPLFKYFKVNSITNVIDYVLSWQSKGFSSEIFKVISMSNNSLTPAINYYGTKIKLKFSGSCLKQSKISYTHVKVVNIYIVYELGVSSSNVNDPTLKNCLFGAVTLTKNADIDKYRYSGHGIGFDRRSSFSFPGDGFGQNVLILEGRCEFFCSY